MSLLEFFGIKSKEKKMLEAEAKTRKILTDAWGLRKKGRINKDEIPDISIKIVKGIMG